MTVSLTSAPSESEPQDDTAVTHGARRLRILVADDNRDWLDSLATLLEIGGHDVRAANDGLEAIETADSFHPDVAILDIGMPGLNGYDVARRVRGEAWSAKTVLIAATGWGQDQDRKNAIEAGFNLHMTKPVDIAALQALITDAAVALRSSR